MDTKKRTIIGFFHIILKIILVIICYFYQLYLPTTHILTVALELRKVEAQDGSYTLLDFEN